MSFGGSLMPLMNALSILWEIKVALKDLMKKNEPYLIYTSKLPTTLDDRKFLKEVLSEGELYIYDKPTGTKTIAFDTLIKGVWINVFFSERNPSEPILEVLEVNYLPQFMSFPLEDLKEGFKKLATDINELSGELFNLGKEILAKLENFINSPQEGFLIQSSLLKDLLEVFLTDGDITIEIRNKPEKIVSTNYAGLWIHYNLEEPIKLYIGNFPPPFKVKKEDIEKALSLLEYRKELFLKEFEH